MVLLAVVLLSGALLLFVAGVIDLSSGPLAQRQALAAVLEGEDTSRMAWLSRLDRAFRRTWLGRRMAQELVLAGSDRSPLVVGLTGLAVAIAAGALLWNLFAPLFGIVGILLGFVVLRLWLRRGQDRRREALVAQMPELARVLANATYAGLSISTAIAIAGDELDEPARSEMRQVSTSLSFGHDLESALTEMRGRLASREVALLMSTLLVSARAGGSLVTSLRSIAHTLEERKETRREIRSTLAQSVATGYTVIVMGFGLLLLLNVLNPGTVEEMTRATIGQLALLFAGASYTAGFLAIRRMTRFEV